MAARVSSSAAGSSARRASASTRSARSSGSTRGAAVLQRGGAQVGDDPVGDRRGARRAPRATSSVSASTEAWPSASISASSAWTASRGMALGGGEPRRGELELGVGRLAGADGGVVDQPRLGGAAGVEQPVDERGRQQRAQVGRQRGEGGLHAGEARGVAEGRRGAAEREPEAVAPGQAASRASGPSGGHGPALDDAREVGEERAVLDRAPRGRPPGAPRPRRRSRSGCRAARGRAPPRGSARRTRRRAGGGARAMLGVSGSPLVQAPTSSRSSGRQTPGGGGSAAARARGGCRGRRRWSRRSGRCRPARRAPALGGVDAAGSARIAVRVGGPAAAGRGGDLPASAGRERRVGVVQPDEPLVGGALDLADQRLLGAGHDRGLAGGAGLRRSRAAAGGRAPTAGGPGVAVGDVEREVAGADEGGADPAVAAEVDGDGGAGGVAARRSTAVTRVCGILSKTPVGAEVELPCRGSAGWPGRRRSRATIRWSAR